MLQRIQTIFLALAAGASFGSMGMPFATTPEAAEASMLFADAAFTVQDHIALLALFAVGGALAVASIVLFKNRALQMRLSLLSFFALLAGSAFGIVLFVMDRQTAAGTSIALGAFLPLAALILLLLAYRFIKKDEKLVRSMDRLR
jgi:hypothetical protein